MGRFTRWLFKDFLKEHTNASQELVEKLLDVQRDRIKSDAELDKLRRDIEFKSRELELSHLSELAEEKRKDRAHKEQLRQMRVNLLAKAREKKAELRANGGLPRAVPGRVPGCVVCGDPSSANLTADEIKWHSAGHPGAMQ